MALALLSLSGGTLYQKRFVTGIDPLLSLLVIEGMIKRFDADVDFQAEALPVLRRRNIPRQVTAPSER